MAGEIPEVAQGHMERDEDGDVHIVEAGQQHADGSTTVSADLDSFDGITQWLTEKSSQAMGIVSKLERIPDELGIPDGRTPFGSFDSALDLLQRHNELGGFSSDGFTDRRSATGITGVVYNIAIALEDAVDGIERVRDRYESVEAANMMPTVEFDELFHEPSEPPGESDGYNFGVEATADPAQQATDTTTTTVATDTDGTVGTDQPETADSGRSV